MISAGGLSATNSTAGVGTQGVGIESQLGRLQQQLSECVNCPTANTPEGKSKIQALSDQIGAIKTRMLEVQPVNANQIQDGQSIIPPQASFTNRPVQGATVGGVINISV